jgi:hypothetical protein
MATLDTPPRVRREYDGDTFWSDDRSSEGGADALRTCDGMDNAL